MMCSNSDSDKEFWDLGRSGEQYRKSHHRKSNRFPRFNLSDQENDGEHHTSGEKKRSNVIEEYNKQSVKNYTSDKKSFSSDYSINNDEKHESNEEENVNEDSDNKISLKDIEDKQDRSSGSSVSTSSKRTSLLTGSDLPQDSPKDASHSKDSSGNSKISNLKSQCIVEDYLLPPQQKLKMALYHGRKLLAAGEGEGAVREFVRARALARIVHGDQHWRYCRCKVFLAKTYLYIKDFVPQAEIQAREALDTLRKHLSTHLAPAKKPQVHHTLLWGHLLCGEARTRLGHLVKAQESLSQALYHTRIYARMVLRWKKQLSPSLTIDLPLDLQVKVLCAQGNLLVKQKNITKAKEKLQSSITLIEKNGSGPEDPCLVTPLQKLGQVLLDHPQTDQDKKKGIECLARVVHITQVSNRPGSVAECEARGLLLQHRLQLHNIDTQEALRELHKLGLLFSRLHGEHSPRAVAIHNLTVQSTYCIIERMTGQLKRRLAVLYDGDDAAVGPAGHLPVGPVVPRGPCAGRTLIILWIHILAKQ